MPQTVATKIYLFIMAIFAWFALAAQFYINISSSTAVFPEVVIRYFSYFTILTNLLVAVCCTAQLLIPASSWGTFFSRQKTMAATAVYIFVVGLIYNLILRHIWAPQGLQKVVDELLHTIIPSLFVIYWLVFVPKDQLRWQSVFPWLIYPLLYIIYVFIRGSFSGFYPYPFINASHLGFTKAATNAAVIALVFIIISLLFVAIGNLIHKRKINLAHGHNT